MRDPATGLLDLLRGLPGISERIERGGGRRHYAAHGRIIATLWLADDAPWLLAFQARSDLLPVLLEVPGIIPAPGQAHLGWVAVTDPAALGKLNLFHLLREAIRASRQR